jgi:hypothetical protein
MRRTRVEDYLCAIAQLCEERKNGRFGVPNFSRWSKLMATE